MRLIDADELYYEDVECTDGNTYLVVHAPTIDNADVFDLEAHDADLLDKVAEKIEKGCTCTDYSCGSPFNKDCTNCNNYMIDCTSIIQIIEELKAEASNE